MYVVYIIVTDINNGYLITRANNNNMSENSETSGIIFC